MAEMPEPEALLEHRAFLRAIAKGLLRDEDAAEDVAQETLLAAMERPPQGRNVRGWLGAVARNLSLMARRGERRRHARELKAARPEAVAPADEAIALIELQRKIVEAVRALDEPYRTAIVLHYFHDLSVTELARRLRVPKETARTRLRRGLAILRARLDSGYGGSRSWAPLLLVLAVDPKKASVAGVALMSAKTKVAVVAIACILVTLVTVRWGGLG
ncbi:MAG: RNA polymerase sigma factor, partial [Planctomycetota bacterium]